jgi:TRAP-type C4-dicarboxylate transport system permease large subunit
MPASVRSSRPVATSQSVAVPSLDPVSASRPFGENATDVTECPARVRNSRPLATSHILASARSSASIGLLVGGSLVFNYVVTVENIPNSLSAIIAGYKLSSPGFLLLVNITLLILGCLLEGITILLVIVPIFIPTANALGIDMVHFGVVVVVNLMIGLITPPYGLLLFVVANVARAGLLPIIRDIAPFLVVMLTALVLITLLPDAVLWLPRVLGYSG